MKKRKNIILSAITCFVSICMLMFGVYSASNPSVTIGGQVSYTARDAKVLVRGKVNGAKGTTTVDYPAIKNLGTNTVNADKVTDQSTTYLDYTAGTGNIESDNLTAWNVGTLNFDEDTTGIKAITMNFELTNLSTYPVQANITFVKDDTALANANVTRTASATSTTLAQNGGKTEITVTYKVKDDSKGVSATDLLAMNITFAKAESPANSVSEINKNDGKVTMGKKSDSSTTEDVQWKCFAYSTDGTTWTANTGAIPANAKYGYFVLDTYVSSLNDQYFLKYSKYNSSTYMHTDISGVTDVKANDYYYSDIRQTLKGLETTLSINTDSDIYKSIKARTISDLYKNNLVGNWNSSTKKYATSDQTLPTNADGTESDVFWIMSTDEAQTYFSDDTARIYPDSWNPYWLRSPSNTSSRYNYCVSEDGTIYDYEDIHDLYTGSLNASPAFKLQLV